MRQIGALATSVEKLAVSMQSMLKEQEKQGKRLEALEGRDGEVAQGHGLHCHGDCGHCAWLPV